MLCILYLFKFLKLIKDNKNNIKEAVIMEGPEGELIFRDINNPNKTERIPPIVDRTTIFRGLSDKFLAIAAGMISIPVINNRPTILMAIAIIAAIKIVKIVFVLFGFIPSAKAKS